MRRGEIEILPLLDARGVFGPLVDLYPGVSADAWEPYGARYVDLFDGDRWRPPLTCHLIRSGGRTVLVDAGVGRFEWLAEPELVGGLLSALAQHRVAPGDVDTVFLTHVHVDHVGPRRDGLWSTRFST